MKKLALFSLCATVVLLGAGVASGQSCSDLTVSGTLVSGGTATFDVTGSFVDSTVVILVSTDLGPATVGPVTLGIGFPFLPVVFGQTDALGAFSHTIDIPAVPAAWSIGPVVLHAQAATVDTSGIVVVPGAPPTIPVCLSDVETFTVVL